MRRFLILMVALTILTPLSCTTKKDAPAGKTVVTVWAHQGQESEVKAIKEIISAFNKAHDKIHAELTIIPSGFKHSYETKVTSAKLSGKLPDILDLDGPFVAQYAWSGILQPIGELVTPDMKSDFLPSIINQGTYNEKLYALGAFSSGVGLFFNKKLVEKAGVTPPESVDKAWTWDQFLSALEKVKKTGITPLSLNMDWGPGEWYTYAFTPIIWSAGQESIIAPDGTTTSGYLDSEISIDALTKFQNFFTRKLSIATPPPDMFEQGKAAFAWSVHGLMKKYEGTEGLEWGLAPLPYIKNRAAPSGSWCWGITSQAKDKKTAFEVLSWIVGSETGIVPMVMANDAPPARISAYNLLPEYQKNPRKILWDQLTRYAHSRPITPSYGVISEKFSDTIQNVALDKDPREQLEKAVKASNDALKLQTKIKK